MTSNIGTFDRIFRLVVGIVLLAAPFVTQMALFQSTVATVIAVVAGIVMLATSATRFCPLYRVLGLRTCKTV